MICLGEDGEMKMEEKKIPPRKEIKKVGVVGCGQMGSGYVQLCAQKGYQVVVSEVNDELLNKGLALINARLTESVSKGPLSAGEKENILARISGTTNLQSLSDCDIVIEAAIEKMEAKKKIFAELDKVCSKDILLATNTSVLSVLDMAMATTRPDKVLGIHMNPLIFPIAEIIKTIVTSNETVEVAKNFSQSLGKYVVIAKDTPGFIINRLITPLFLEAIRMLESGISGKDEIDAAFTRGMGWPVGPFAMIDGVGLDTLLLGTNALYEDLKNPQFVPPILLKKMVTAGQLGVKTGKGFYEYQEPKKDSKS
jgi:3-hydroxybutyryl-CoA dehydrogenase